MDVADPSVGVTDLMVGADPTLRRQLGALWGKSAERAGGRANLLLSHLLDTAAVAELIWDRYLAPSLQRALDEVAGGGEGSGRRLFVWLCGVHDFGKAVPAFQFVDEAGMEGVRRAGLPFDLHALRRRRWRHDAAGGVLIRPLLKEAGWSEDQVGWVWPLIAGHHGLFPSLGEAALGMRSVKRLSGEGAGWDQVRRQLLDIFTRAVGFADLAGLQPRRAPSRALQLQVSGFVVMADWISSDKEHFKGIDALGGVSMQSARGRALAAWSRLGLRGGWGRLSPPDHHSFVQRFGETPRRSQDLVLSVVARMGAPGLVIVEAPMGEGKSKAALLAAEMLAARFGMDGVFVGMPTQATSDPMFTNVRKWLCALDPGLENQAALLHGKRMFNKEWRALVEGAGERPDDRFDSIQEDDFGLDDPYRSGPAERYAPAVKERCAPAEWFLGSKRGLLSPFVVGTIDQLLFAATRTKHVMLRMAGLAGKVVILDEVHAVDVYMSQFLAEGLRWLGQAGVPVVLLSATLPSAQRRELQAAYLAGAQSREDVDVSEVPAPSGYPSVTAVWNGPEGIAHAVEECPAWKAPVAVRIEVLPEAPPGKGDENPAQISARDRDVVVVLKERLVKGGCALVIRNTVDRAQQTYRALREEFGDDVRLLHGRLTVAERADRTEECLRLLGPSNPEGPARPERLILVATQIAEQSFDIDADVLITDLAPMDLLLQRMGRVHRHADVARPDELCEPRVIVTGFSPRESAAPWILSASVGIYGRYLLLRTAAVVTSAADAAWSIPRQVPELVAAVYDSERDTVPAAWAEAEAEALTEWTATQRSRAEGAEPFLLSRRGEHERTTLEGLHRGGARETLDEEHHRAMVRDGQTSIEVVLVRQDRSGYRTLSGRWLGITGEASTEVIDDLLGATVRLPAKLTQAAEGELRPLPEWREHPWLRHSRALVFPENRLSAPLGDVNLTYDEHLGLIVR